jgi:excisionase family DNA binding protein
MAFEYMTVRQAAEKWNVTMRRVQQLCERGRIDGLIRPGREWLIPADAQKPGDTRGDWHKKSGKQSEE